MPTREENIFQQALEISSKSDRDAFLEANCVGQPELLQSVRSLLDSWEQGSFLEATLPEISAIRAFGTDVDGQALGPYRIIRRLGQGGMGTVFLAEQQEPVARKVAIKIVRPELDSSSVIERFLQEQQTLAKMDHPNIARVLDASISQGGISYFVMEFVDGVPILEYCRQNAVTIPNRLRLFLECCLAIRHAHQNSIIHRDIKPSNTLVTVHDLRPTVKVIDFGIAKAIDPAPPSGAAPAGDISALRIDEFVGTPQYMSPEQASMGRSNVDTRTDIYSLGALLYALLTDLPPFEPDLMKNQSLDELQRIVQTVEPLPPSLRVLRVVREKSVPSSAGSELASPKYSVSILRQKSDAELRRMSSCLRGDLDAIVRKAMDKSPDRRYATVVELAEDVDRFLKSEPVLARTQSALYRISKFAQRRKGVLVSTITTTLCLIIGLVVAVKQAHRAVEAERIARREANRAIAAERQMAESLYASDLRLASAETLRQNSAAALEFLRRHEVKNRAADHRGFDWHYLMKQNTPSSQELFRTKQPLYFMARIDQTSQLVCCGAEGIVHVLDEKTGHQHKEFLCGQGEVNGVSVSPDETLLATAGDDGTIVLWQLPEFSEIRRLKVHDRQAYQVAWSPDSLQFATCGNEPNARVWSVASGEMVLEIPTERSLECLAASHAGDLAIGSEGGFVYLTKFPGAPHEQPPVVSFGSNIEVHCAAVCFSEDSQLMASGRDNGVLLIHRVTDQFQTAPLETRMSDGITSIMFDADAQNIAVGLQKGGVSIVQLTASYDDRMRLTIDGSLQDEDGRFLDGNYDGKGGDPWVSSKSEQPAENDPGIPADQLPPQVVRIEPPLIDGSLPMNTSTVQVHFSRPIRNSQLIAGYRFSRGRLWKDVDDEIILPSYVGAAGSIVTLSLPESPWTQSRISGSESPIAVASELIHETEVTRVTSYRHEGTLTSCGNDGRVVRFSPRILRGAKPVMRDVEDFDFGIRTLWLRDRLGRMFVRNLDAPEGRLISPRLPDDQKYRMVSIAEKSGDAIFVTGGESTSSTFHIEWMNPDTESLEPVKTSDLTGAVGRHAISNDGRYFAVAIMSRDAPPKNETFKCVLADLTTGTATEFETDAYVTRVTFSPDGQFLAIPTNHDVRIVDTKSARVIQTIVIPNLRCVAVTAAGKELLSVSDDGELVVWDISTGDATHTLKAHAISALHVDVNRDGMTVATVGLDGWLRLWRRGVWQVTTEQRFPWPLVSCDFSGDGQFLTVMDERGSVYVLDAGNPMPDLIKTTEDAAKASVNAIWE